MIAFDIETNGRDYLDSEFKIIMLVCYSGGDKAKCYPRDNIQRGVEYLQAAVNQGEELVGHNASMFDRACIQRVFNTNLKTHDTMFMAYLLDEQHEKGKYKLETLVQKYIPGTLSWKNDVTWDWRDTDSWETQDPRWEIMRRYCIRDTVYTHRLSSVLYPELERQNLLAVYRGVLLPASRALSAVYERGVCVNHENIEKALAQAREEKTQSLGRLNLFGIKNPGSTKQLKELFFNQAKLAPVRYTPAGEPSVDELTLKTLDMQLDEADPLTPVLHDVLTYRGAVKEIGTYLENYAEMAQKSPDKRVHPSYGLVTTVSGRTSAYTPNIQNIPRNSRIRSVIAASANKHLLQADLSQIELRMAAHVFNERAMLAAFARGDDLHYIMAEAITQKPRAKILDEERTNAKITNFMFLYGAEVSTFIDNTFKNYGLLFSYETANAYRDRFYALWADLIPAYGQVRAELVECGFVTSLTNRRRRFFVPEHGEKWKHYNSRQQTAWLREAINFKVQSFASDVALSMLVLLTAKGLPITAYIHDAVHAELSPEETPRWCEIIHNAVKYELPEILQKKYGVELKVPLIVDFSVGPSWGEQKKLKGLNLG